MPIDRSDHELSRAAAATPRLVIGLVLLIAGLAATPAASAGEPWVPTAAVGELPDADDAPWLAACLAGDWTPVSCTAAIRAIGARMRWADYIAHPAGAADPWESLRLSEAGALDVAD